VILSRAATLPIATGPDWAPATIACAIVLQIVLLNCLGRRFWCARLCPLGALLGLCAKAPPVRRVTGAECDECGECGVVCPAGNRENRYARDDCLQCRECVRTCPKDAVAFQFGVRGGTQQPSGHGMSRRGLLAAGGAGLCLGLVGKRPGGSSRRVLRPPLVSDEISFAARCAGCGQCVNVCPTSALQPMMLEAGLAEMFTPKLVPRVGYCEPDCVACGAACPTDAIPSFTASQKDKMRIGLAVIDRSTCLPWAKEVRCLVCRDTCAYGAIELRLEGEELRPYVKEPLCTGCGICEHECPVKPAPAVRVIATG